MAIKLIPSTKGDYAPTLRFKDLAKKDYLIVSKLFDTPLSGPSQFCKNTGGNWYLFKLTLHEYSFLDDDEERQKITDEQEVSYFDGDNEYEKDDGSFIQSQGTILKALNNAEVGEKLKITMIENDKGKKVYKVETISTTSSSSNPDTAGPSAETAPTLDDEIKTVKAQGAKLEDVAAGIAADYDVTETQVANRWAVL